VWMLSALTRVSIIKSFSGELVARVLESVVFF